MPPPQAPLSSATEVAAARAQRCLHPCDECYGTRDTVDGKESYSEQAKRVFFSIGESLQPPSCAASKLKVKFNEGSKNVPNCNGINEEKQECYCDKTELCSKHFRVTRALDNCKGAESFERLYNKLESRGILVESKHSKIPSTLLKHPGKNIDKGFANVRSERQIYPLRDKCTGSELPFKETLGESAELPRSRVPPRRRSSACLVRGARVRSGGEGARACRSWYGDYGTLTEEDTSPDNANCWKQPSASAVSLLWAGAGGRKVAESATLLETRAAPSAAVARRPRALHVLLGAVAAARSRDSLNDSPHVPLPLPIHNGSPRGIRKCSTTAALTSRRPEGADVVLRKCPTAASLGGAGAGVEPMRPVNRLRPGSSGLCSRCSSLLSLAAGGSRYSLDVAGSGGFAPVASPSPSPSRCPAAPALLCKLCLDTVPAEDTTRIEQCLCAFCTKCMRAYVEFEVGGGAHEVSCPDASCSARGVLQQREVAALAGSDALERLRRFRLNHEVVMDASRAWCPRAGCETVCRVDRDSVHPPLPLHPPHPLHPAPHEVSCPTCEMHFCSECNQEWHEGATCDEAGAAAAEGAEPLLPSSSELIKWCPMCRVPIEKDEGCAQMMCKRCKHVFCWFCLASLDDDFLLRHYDKGPCKNKLGHSRASVIWHRAQVVGIFAGFGLLLLVASPLLLLAAPCIVCCKCRLCSSNGAKNVDDGDEAETLDLQRDRSAEGSSPDDDIQRLPDAD